MRHGFDDSFKEPCPVCGGKLNRLFNPTGIVFKGSGFYITDSRKAESKTSDKPEKPESKPSQADAAPSAKTESATPSATASDKPPGKPSAA